MKKLEASLHTVQLDHHANHSQQAQASLRRALASNYQWMELLEPSPALLRFPLTRKPPLRSFRRAPERKPRRSALTQAGIRLVPTIFHVSAVIPISLQIVG